MFFCFVVFIVFHLHIFCGFIYFYVLNLNSCILLYAGEFFWITKNGIWMCYAIVKFGFILHIDSSWALGWDLCFKKRRRRGKRGKKKGGGRGKKYNLVALEQKGEKKERRRQWWQECGTLWHHYGELQAFLNFLQTYQVWQVGRFMKPIGNLG